MPGKHCRIPLVSTLVAALVVMGTDVTAVGQGPPGFDPPPAGPLVTAHAAADVGSITPGATFHVAVTFTIARHWHIYWKNAGVVGSPTLLTIDAPEGFEVGEVRFPRPKAIRDDLGVSYGYEGEVSLFVPITAPKDLVPESQAISITADYLVCRVSCVLGKEEVSVTLPVGEAAPIPQFAPKIQREFEALPRPLHEQHGAELQFDGRTLRISVPVEGADADHMQFFPGNTPGVTYGEPVAALRGTTLVWEVPVTIKPGNALGQPLAVGGIVAIGDKRHDQSWEFHRLLAGPEYDRLAPKNQNTQ